MSKSSSENKYSKFIYVISLGIILLIGFMLGNYYNQTKLDSASNSNNSSQWLTYTHNTFSKPEGWEVYPWLGFKMTYLSSWKVEEERRDESTGDLSLHVSKEDGSYFDILQGFGEGGRCLFPDDTDYSSFQGMGTRYEKYVQIDKDEVKWRLATYVEPDELWTHALCEFKDGKYYSSNLIGLYKIKLATQESEYEFIEILQKLEILN